MAIDLTNATTLEKLEAILQKVNHIKFYEGTDALYYAEIHFGGCRYINLRDTSLEGLLLTILERKEMRS